MKIILIGGYGKWGQNYVSTFKTFPDQLILADRYLWKKQIEEEKPQGVIIATPPQSHIEIAQFCLDRNIPVMIEKPLALSLEEAEKLKKYNIPILINHNDLFSRSFEKAIQICKYEKIESIRFDLANYTLPRDYSVLWDYGPHPLALILTLASQLPNKIEIDPLYSSGPPGSQSFLIWLRFDHFGAEIMISNNRPKTRKWTIDFDGLNLKYNDLNRPSFYQPPLTKAVDVFLKGIEGQSDFRLGIGLGLKVIKTLEMCENSMNNGT